MFETLCRPLALLLDMDGTLTEPMLDFNTIKAEMRIGSRAILETMDGMNAADRTRAQAILDRHEAHAARHSTLAPGCRALLDWLAEHSIPSAIVTRNSKASAAMVMQLHRLPFEILVTRDDGVFKPDPAPLALAAERLGVALKDCWMVGDGRFDIEAARAAGVRSVWVSLGRERSFAAVADVAVADLHELLALLRHTRE